MIPQIHRVSSLRFGEFRQYISMAALWRAPATEDLPFQFGLRGRQQLRTARAGQPLSPSDGLVEFRM
jgi:hypothetical protein